MQDLVVDKLASKRIPAASRITALPHLVAADWARSLRGGGIRPAAAQNHPASTAAKPAVSASPTTNRVYTGTMTLGGTFTDSLGQNGNWSGVLHEQLFVTIDASGNGSGYET